MPSRTCRYGRKVNTIRQALGLRPEAFGNIEPETAQAANVQIVGNPPEHVFGGFGIVVTQHSLARPDAKGVCIDGFRLIRIHGDGPGRADLHRLSQAARRGHQDPGADFVKGLDRVFAADRPLEVENGADVQLAEDQEFLRPENVAELRLADPVDHLIDAVGRFDMQHDRIVGGEVLHVVYAAFLQAEPRLVINPVDNIERDDLGDIDEPVVGGLDPVDQVLELDQEEFGRTLRQEAEQRRKSEPDGLDVAAGYRGHGWRCRRLGGCGQNVGGEAGDAADRVAKDGEQDDRENHRCNDFGRMPQERIGRQVEDGDRADEIADRRDKGAGKGKRADHRQLLPVGMAAGCSGCGRGAYGCAQATGQGSEQRRKSEVTQKDEADCGQEYPPIAA